MRVAERARICVEIHPALLVPRQQLHARADDHRVIGRLVRKRVVAVAGDDLAAARHLGQHADEIAHRAAGDEQRRFLAGQLGGALLERDDRRVVAENVVANLGVGHRAAHLWRWLGDGVGAQIDHVVGHRSPSIS